LTTVTATVRRSAASRDPVPLVDVLGMRFHAMNFATAVDELLDLAQGERCAYVVTANVDHLVRYTKRPELRYLYERADFVLADGTPLIWASRLLGTPLPERVAGSDLFPALCARAAECDLSVFLFGGAPGTADAAAETMKKRHPRLCAAGTYCPSYGFENDPAECERIVATIRAARPDILFVGLGSPKQEQWIVANKDACGAKLNIGVGISFSFACGHVKRAPRWMQRVGLEWLHRTLHEPRRLAKRYLLDDTAFLPLVIREMVRRRLLRNKRWR